MSTEPGPSADNIWLVDTPCPFDPAQDISTDRLIRWAVADYLRDLADRAEVGRIAYVHVKIHGRK